MKEMMKTGWPLVQPTGVGWSRSHISGTSWQWLCPGERPSPAPGTHPLLSIHQTISVLSVWSELKLGHGEGAVQCWLRSQQIILCMLIHWLSTSCEQQKICNHALRNLRIGFKITVKSSFFSIFSTPFSVNIYKLPANFQMESKELQSDIQIKENFDRVSLPDFLHALS